MTKHHFPRRLLDDAIDRAVQDLVQADPRPGLRRRVLAQLNDPPKRVWWAPRLLVPAGALIAAAVLAIWMLPSAPPAAPLPEVVAQTSAPATTAQSPAPSKTEIAIAARPVARPQRETVRPRQAPTQFTFGPRSDRVAATSVTEPGGPAVFVGAPAEGSTADAPSPLPPVHIAPIEVKPIEVKPIVLKPIGAGSGPTP